MRVEPVVKPSSDVTPTEKPFFEPTTSETDLSAPSDSEADQFSETGHLDGDIRQRCLQR